MFLKISDFAFVEKWVRIINGNVTRTRYNDPAMLKIKRKFIKIAAFRVLFYDYYSICIIGTEYFSWNNILNEIHIYIIIIVKTSKIKEITIFFEFIFSKTVILEKNDLYIHIHIKIYKKYLLKINYK